MKYEESSLQQACVRWFNLQFSNLRMLLFAVPNGGNRNAFEAARLQSEGVVAGVSDLILLAPNSRGQVLCIEMKTGKGKQTENQKAFQLSVENTGNKYVICRSLDDFMIVVKKHLKE
jgi:hypothetical protein